MARSWSLEVKFVSVKNSLFLSKDYLVYIRDFALIKGISAKTLVGNSGIDIDILLNPPQRVSAQIFHQLGFNLFNSLAVPYAGVIELGQGMVLSMHGSLGLAVQGAKSLNEVAKLAEKYHLTRANFRILEQIENRNHSNLRLSESQPEYDMYFAMAELISFQQVIDQLLKHHHLQEHCCIHLKSSEPENFPWKMIKGYQIKFNQTHNQLQIPIQWMDLAISPNDIELAGLAKDQCQQIMEELSPLGLVNEIRQRLKLHPSKNTSLKEMAEQLHLSASTLQRRLRELNTTYKDIKLDVRLLASTKLLLNSEYSIEQISEHLGFSDASSFTKSFKTFSGQTPAVYRNKHSR